MARRTHLFVFDAKAHAGDVVMERGRVAKFQARGKLILPAGVAELADAPDSKSGGRKAVWVRFPPPAPNP
jgi:hypothetical protein